MKIYRNISMPAVIICVSMIVFVLVMFMFMGIFTFEQLFTLKSFFMLYSFTTAFVFMTMGDITFTRFYKENAGYKYFRSIPNAFERMKTECIRMDAIELIALLLNIAPIALSGFTDTFHVVVYEIVMLVFALNHFVNASTRVNNYTAILTKSI